MHPSTDDDTTLEAFLAINGNAVFEAVTTLGLSPEKAAELLEDLDDALEGVMFYRTTSPSSELLNIVITAMMQKHELAGDEAREMLERTALAYFQA